MVFQTISVIGLGYIGLPTATVFASRKIKVIGVDVNREVVDNINQGKIHITEPDLDIAVRSAVNSGYLRATMSPEPADAFLVAVPTPFKNDHKPDLGYIEAATKAIATVLKAGDLVILESTSPVGTTQQMATWMAEVRPDLTFPQTHGQNSAIRVAHCPERVLPGRIMRELIENDRVIGGLTEKCSKVAVELYKTFVQGECVITSARTAEMAKLTENSFRDVNIAFANELSLICDKLNINVWELIKLANRHPRVNILQPGPGVGGHCIAVDPWFIVSKTPDQAKLIKTSRDVNENKIKWVVEKINSAIQEKINANKMSPVNLKIICYGITFKANIDDLRESTALNIVRNVVKTNPGETYVIEPNVSDGFSNQNLIRLIDLAEQKKYDIPDSIHVLLVDHREFFDKKPTRGLIIDTKGIWS